MHEPTYIKDLYTFRKLYNAALFNEWARQSLYFVHKSLRHYDDNLCFNGEMFIVAAKLPTGIISNHYAIEDWELFKIQEVPQCLFEYDGHLPKDVLSRLTDFLRYV